MERLIKAVMNTCNMSREDAEKNILSIRQNYEENIAYDSERSYMYLQEALQDLGLESDYTEDFLTEVPYKPVEIDSEDEEDISSDEILDWFNKNIPANDD